MARATAPAPGPGPGPGLRSFGIPNTQLWMRQEAVERPRSCRRTQKLWTHEKAAEAPRSSEAVENRRRPAGRPAGRIRLACTLPCPAPRPRRPPSFCRRPLAAVSQSRRPLRVTRPVRAPSPHCPHKPLRRGGGQPAYYCPAVIRLAMLSMLMLMLTLIPIEVNRMQHVNTGKI